MPMVDYYLPKPLESSNLASHFLFGVANAPVDKLTVSDRFVRRGKLCVTVDARQTAEKPRTALAPCGGGS